MTYGRLRSLLLAVPTVERGVGASGADIAAAEERLGPLPREYQQFLREFGWLVVRQYEITGRALKMRYILVLQWSRTSGSDFDDIIALEDALEESLGGSAEVEGHDFGPTEMNIFIHTDQPSETFLAAEAAGASWEHWPEVRAAYRETTGESYTVLWPPDLTGFAVT